MLRLATPDMGVSALGKYRYARSPPDTTNLNPVSVLLGIALRVDHRKPPRRTWETTVVQLQHGPDFQLA